MARTSTNKNKDLAQAALQDYVTLLDNFLTDDNYAMTQVVRQDTRLSVWKERHYRRFRDMDLERYTPGIQDKLKTNYSLIKTGINSARSKITASEEDVVTMLRDQLQFAREALGENCSIDNLPKLVGEHIDNIKKSFQAGRSETKDLFQEIDLWYAWGNEYAYTAPSKGARMQNLLLMPQEISRAKWLFMLSLANAAYDIGLEANNDRPSDNHELVLVSRMLERLSKHERGGANPHMPPDCKLRHNPAIHSLHVVALLKKMFDQAERAIKADPTIHGKKDDALSYLHGMRKKLMFSALLHDMGELEGELSEGIDVSGLDPKERAKQKADRNEIEPKVFEYHLDDLATKKTQIHHGAAHGEVLYDERRWKKGSPGQPPLRDRYIEANELTDQPTFEGRFLKSLETMQSQQDYLRFQRQNDDPDYPKLHEPPFCKSEIGNHDPDDVARKTAANIEFSTNYVSRPLRDARYDEPEGSASLRAKVSECQNPIERYVQEKLHTAIMEEYDHLMQEICAAYRVPPPPPSQPTRNIRGNGASASLYSGNVTAEPRRY